MINVDINDSDFWRFSAEKQAALRAKHARYVVVYSGNIPLSEFRYDPPVRRCHTCGESVRPEERGWKKRRCASHLNTGDNVTTWWWRDSTPVW